MTDQTTAKGAPAEFVYLGVRQGPDNKPRAALAVIYENGNLSPTRVYAMTKDFKRRVIGGVYKGARFDEDKAMYGAPVAVFDRLWPDAEQRAIWQALAQDEEANMAVRRVEADERRISEIDKAMIPLRKIYHAAIKRGDLLGAYAVERAIVRSLHRPLRDAEKGD